MTCMTIGITFTGVGEKQHNYVDWIKQNDPEISGSSCNQSNGGQIRKREDNTSGPVNWRDCSKLRAEDRNVLDVPRILPFADKDARRALDRASGEAAPISCAPTRLHQICTLHQVTLEITG